MIAARSLGALLAALASLLAATASAGQTGRIEGQVALTVEGASLANAGPIVVYVQREQAVEGQPGAEERPEIRQRNARFTPGFMAVAQGVTIDMPNDDDVDHNVYSASGKNQFDLGTYESGESRSVKMKHAGQVEIHCSIHESMNGTIFVSPSPFYSAVDAEGRFAIADLPPGRYRLRTWSQRLPQAELFLRVGSGETLRTTVRIGAPASSD